MKHNSLLWVRLWNGRCPWYSSNYYRYDGMLASRTVIDLAGGVRNPPTMPGDLFVEVKS